MRSVVRLLAALIASALLVGPVVAQSTASGGIGLAQEDWEAIYGEGEPGQTLVEFQTEDGDPLYVGLDDGFISYLEADFTAAPNGGLSYEDAEAFAEALLPDDAELASTATMPNGPANPVDSYVVQVWESDWLEDDVWGDDRDTVTILYRYVRGVDTMDSFAATIAISAED